MMRIRLLAAALFLLSAAHCGGPPTPPTDSGSAAKDDAGASPVVINDALAKPTTPPPPPAEVALPQPGPPVVTVIDAGAEPRKALRYSFKKTNETMIIDMRMDLVMSLPTGKTPLVTMPTVRTSIEVKPVSVDPDGTLTATFEVKKVEVLDDRPGAKAGADMKKKLDTELQKIVGMKGKTVVTSRGVTKEASVEVPPDASPQVEQMVDSIKDSLRNMSNPFPEEPVGKNAKWDVKSVVAGLMTFQQTATYTLKDMTEKGVQTEVTIVQVAPPQTMKPNAALPPGTIMALRAHNSSGSGTQKIAFNHMTPTATVKLASKSEMEVTAGTEKQSIGIELTVDMTIKGK